MKPMHLWIDQYGGQYWARTVKELREKVGGGEVSKMYRETAAGPPVHCGYVVGRLWLTRFAPVEV